ncbi:MAG: transposase [Betaproteobacteria bacterium]|nr:transposase [Betaproteobacteria bacterium]
MIDESRTATWEISDEFWSRVEPLLPPAPGRDETRRYAGGAGRGRKRKDPRTVFTAIVYVLRTGCQWKALPAERFGSASAIHKRFLEWEKAGVFVRLGQAGLAEYDDLLSQGAGRDKYYSGISPQPFRRLRAARVYRFRYPDARKRSPV